MFNFDNNHQRDDEIKTNKHNTAEKLFSFRIILGLKERKEY